MSGIAQGTKFLLQLQYNIKRYLCQPLYTTMLFRARRSTIVQTLLGSLVRILGPGYPIRFSRSGELDIIRYSTALVIALPAPVGVRLGPPPVDKTSYRAGRTIRYHPAF